MIVLVALFILLVSLPATIVLVALTIAASGLAAASEGTIVRPASPAGEAPVGPEVAMPEAAA